MGDSITEGDFYEGAYRLWLYFMLDSAGIDFDYVGSLSYGPDSLPDKDHSGYSGYTVRDIIPVAQEDAGKYQPDLVLLMIGTNDMWWFDSSTITAYDSLLTLIFDEQPDAIILASSIPPIDWPSADSTVRVYNREIENLVNTRTQRGDAVVFVDVYARLTLSDLADGVHLNRSGNYKTALAWFEAVIAQEPVLTNRPVRFGITANRHTARPQASVFDFLGRRASPAGLCAAGILINAGAKLLLVRP